MSTPLIKFGIMNSEFGIFGHTLVVLNTEYNLIFIINISSAFFNNRMVTNCFNLNFLNKHYPKKRPVS